MERLRSQLDAPPPSLPAELADAYKFADVPPEFAARAMLDARDRDPFAVTDIASRPVAASGSTNEDRAPERRRQPRQRPSLAGARKGRRG